MGTALPVIDRPPPESELTRPIDNTALDTYMRCPKEYDYSMRQHMRRGGAPSPALAYGSVWHIIMETHYLTNGDAMAVRQAALDAWEPHGIADDHRTLERALAEYDNYVERWGSPEQEHGQTLGAPEEPLVELSVNATWEGALHPYAGKLDRIIEESGQIYIEDHKTTSQMGPQYFKQFELDNQMMGYTVLGTLLTGVRVAGVRINGHAVYKRESKFQREFIPFSPDRLEDWKENYNRWIERIQASYANNDFPRNFKACSRKYGSCPYTTVCSMPPKLRDKVLQHDFDYNPWNPLEAKDSPETE